MVWGFNQTTFTPIIFFLHTDRDNSINYKMKNEQYVKATMITIIWGLIFWKLLLPKDVNMLIVAIGIAVSARLFWTFGNQVIDQKLMALRIHYPKKYTH